MNKEERIENLKLARLLFVCAIISALISVGIAAINKFHYIAIYAPFIVVISGVVFIIKGQIKIHNLSERGN